MRLNILISISLNSPVSTTKVQWKRTTKNVNKDAVINYMYKENHIKKKSELLKKPADEREKNVSGSL